MKSFDEISFLNDMNVSIIKNENPENEENLFFFITSFHNWIWDNKTCYFTSKKPPVELINPEFEEYSDINKDYIYRIFCIKFKNKKKENYVYLLLNYEHLRNLELTELNLKEKTRFTFSDLKISEKFIAQFNIALENKFGNNALTKDNYYLKLNQEKQLAIYKNFLEITFNNNIHRMNEYSQYLAGDFLYTLKKSKVTELNFSTAVNLFILSHKNKYILQFLEICNNFVYIKDDINKDFYNLLNDYISNSDELFTIIATNKGKDRFEDYIKHLENLQITYYSLYRKDILFDDKKIALKSKDILFKIINNRKNIIETTKMIYEYIDVIFSLFDSRDANNTSLKVLNLKEINNLNLNNFSVYYNPVVDYQMKNRKEYFINYSQFIEKLLIIYNNNLINLGKIIILFNYELNQEINYELKYKITMSYYYAGMNLYFNGNLKNEKLLNFILLCDVFKSSRKIDCKITYDKFVNQYNDSLKNKKSINILNEVDINSREGPAIISNIKQNKIYLLFCLDMPKEYIEIFINKISHIKNLGIFFEILPKQNYKPESIEPLYHWILKNLVTFSKEECKSFKNDVNNFFEVLIKLRDDLVDDFMKNLILKLNIFCKELFLYFLNYNTGLTKKVIRDLILYFISSKFVFINNDIKKLDNINYLIINFTKDDNEIISIILKELGYLSINEETLFDLHKTSKYKIFELLLKHKKKFINNRNGEYIDKTHTICSRFILKLKNFNYDSIKLKLMLFNDSEKKKFKNKITNALFFLSLEEKITEKIKEESNQILQKIEEKFSAVEKIRGDLGEASYYLELFFDKNKERMSLRNNINYFINELWMKKLNEIDSESSVKEKLELFKGIIQESKPIMSRQKNSALFVAIYKNNKQKIEDQAYLLEETNKNFVSAIKLLNENPENIHNNYYINFYYEIGYKNDKSLEREIDWLIKNENIKINEEQKSKLLSSFKLLIKKQNIINVINGILILEKIYENNLNPPLDEENYINELKKNLELLKQKISSKEIESIIDHIKFVFNEISFDDNDKNYKNYILPFFNSFNVNKEAFIFFKDIKLNEISNIKQFLLDSDERELTLYEIDEFIQIIKFLNEEIMKIKNPVNLIQTFISGILDKNTFQDYLIIVKDYNKFKNLFDKFLKRESGIFNRIRDIMNFSIFSIELWEEKNMYELDGQYSKSTSLMNPEIAEFIHIKSDELDELYERVFMSLNQDREKDYIKNFIENYRAMKKMLNIINELFLNYGYPEEINIQFNIRLDMKCIFCGKDFKPSELIDNFNEKLKRCKLRLYKANASYEEIRIFYGKQLYLINKCLKEKNFEKIKDLIRCATNGLIKDFNNDFSYIEQEGKDVYKTMINNIKLYIEKQFTYNGKDIKEIYLKNQIQISENDEDKNNRLIIKENDYQGFYYYPTNIEENDILNFFFVLTQSIPMNTNILYCNKETSFREIQTFILRAIYCQIHSLFIIFIPEYINNAQKIYLLKNLRTKALKEQFMMKSCLVVLFNLSDSEFHQSITKVYKINLINLPYLLDFEDKALEKELNVKIISSSICGLGKSSFINNMNNKQKEIIYLPIGGEMTKEELTNRILRAFEKVKIDIKKNYILHVDFTQTDNIEVIKDFLFKLLILKKIEIEENVIYINKNIAIYIELANDFFSYPNKYKIFSIFTNPQIIRSINGIKYNRIKDEENLKKVSVILNSFENNSIIENIPDFEKDYIKDENITNRLILKYLGIQNPNYYQIKSFIRILAFEFEKFNQCHAFSPEIFKENLPYLQMTEIEALSIRKLIIQNFINVTKHFTSGPFEDLIKTQEDTRLVLKEKNLDKDFIAQMENKIEGITYNDIKPSLVVFNLDGGSVSILTTLSEEDQEFKNLKKLYNSQNIDTYKKNKKASKLKNLASLNSSDILAILKNFLNVNLSEKEIKDIVGNYVYTADNLIKVILIILRIRAKVPVIMMGETGCGKTRLIEMAFKLINKNKNISIKRLDIHAGTNDNDIINFIEKTIKEVNIEDDSLYAKESSQTGSKKYLSERKKQIYKREIWIFFDEINTCNSMGLLSEILCNHSYRGTKINKRFIFIAACNPYRLLTKERKMDEILLHKRKNKNMLVYSVNPLPHSLLNFVLYFGRLKPLDEKEYIKSMVISTMELYSDYYKNNKKEFDDLIFIQTECIFVAQNYLKKKNDVSIVSLREVNRFLTFFKFFENFIQKRNKEDPDFNEYKLLNDEIVEYYKNKTIFFYHKVAVILSLFLCYYLRLPDKESRQGLEKQLNDLKYLDIPFLKIPEMEMDYVIKNFEIPPGIAKNRALKENLFSSLFCIVNKVPIIICGKPGRSKTLCIQILENSLKGKISSKSFLCKYFPELIIYKIQGALNTKTDDVLKVFEEARQKQKDELGKDNHLHLVLMDEMGLAELSPNNPLKVTHFELEREDNDKVPFVGISNWALDASKMNRVLYIVVQDPDEEDLIESAKEIVNSYDDLSVNYYNKYSEIFKNLSKAYFSFINKEQKINDENKYFHGSRDFYCLIKCVISDIIKNKENLEFKNNENPNDFVLKLCMKNIERNFGGLENSSIELKSYFIQLFNNIIDFPIYDNDNLLEYLKENLYDTKSRYLLLISENSISKDILKYMIEEINKQVLESKKNQEEDINLRKKEVKVFLGSKFKSDQNSINYCDEILYKIKCEMETENVIILKDLEIVYPSLYELFNQSFTYLLNIKFARLGKSRSLSLVNDKFKVIVLVDKENMTKEDPPFINRFEKHIISFNNILTQELIDISKEIELMIDDIKLYISKVNEYQKNLNNIYYKYLLNTDIKFINNEEIRGLVYIASKKGIKEKDDFFKFVLNKIVPTFTEDIMIIINSFGFKAKYDLYYENILDIYRSNYKCNIKDFIENNSYNLSIIYTFSFINDSLFQNKTQVINNKNFSEIISKDSTAEIYISGINTIKMLDNYMINFIMNNDYNLCILKFRENDLIKLSDIYNLVNGYAINGFDCGFSQDINRKKKMCIILIHVSRIAEINMDNKNLKKYNKKDNSNNRFFISFLSETPQYFIDDINNKNSHFNEILTQPVENIIINTIKKNKLITKQIGNALINIDFTFYNIKQVVKNTILIKEINPIERLLDSYSQSSYRKNIIYQISMNKTLETLIIKSILNLFKNEKEDVFIRLYKNNLVNKDNNDFIEELNKYIEQEVKLYFLKILYLFDKEQILVSFICNENINKSELIVDKLNEYVDNIGNVIVNINIDNINLNNKIKSKILYGIKIPFVQNKIRNDIFNFIKNEISKLYIKNESIIMKKIDDEKMESEKKRYLDNSNILSSKFKNELMNYQFISSILESGEEQLIKDLFNDCFQVFLMKSNILNNDYDSLIELLDLIIQLRFKPRLNNNLDFTYYANDIILSNSFLDIFKIKKENNINEIILEEEDNNNYNDNENNISYTQIFSDVLIFIESYSKEIYSILNVFQYLNNQTERNNIKEIKEMIIDKKIFFDEIRGEKSNKQKINTICFYFVIESILMQIIEFLKPRDFFEIIKHFKKLKYHIMNWFKMDKALSLSSKELSTFEFLINIFEFYEKKSQQSKDELKSEYKDVIIKIMDGDVLFLDKKYGELNKNLIEINELLKKIFDEYSNEYTELISLLTLNRYKLIRLDEMRANILNLLIPEEEKLANKNLLEKLYPLISIILEKSEPEINLDETKNAIYKEKFLNFVTDIRNRQYNYKKYLNKDYPSLNQVIIYFYENCFQNYFNKILVKFKDDRKNYVQNVCGKMSKIYLQEAINYLNSFENKEYLYILGKNYCIAYIKRYLELYMKILMSDDFQYLEGKNDIDRILFSKNEKILTKEIKYYVLKLCNTLLEEKNKNYETFLNYFKEILNIDNKIEYFKDINLNDNKIFFYSMIPLINKDNTFLLLFKGNEKLNQFQAYKDFYESLINKIKNKEAMNDVIIPRELSDYKIKDVYYTYLYFSLCKSILEQKNEIDTNLINNKLVSLFNFSPGSNEDKFIQLIFGESFLTKVLPKIGVLNLEKKEINNIEILFYAFRFVFGILCEKYTNNFYYSLLTGEALNTINKNMIPGKLANTSKLINTFNVIKLNFKKNHDYGAYLCSCGYHYVIDYCSFPIIEYNCPDCGKTIGGKNHILFRREGHVRIFYNQQYREYYLNAPYADKTVPNILLEDLESVVFNEKKKLFKGLKKESKNYFLERRMKVREISYITFRILNFILHGFILYSNLQENLTDQFLEENLIESMTCFEIMKADWDIINSELKIIQIPNVQSFFNIIFDNILYSMKKQKYFLEYNDLENFEKEIENIIQTKLNDDELINEYINDNKIMTDNLEPSDKSIILEEDIYNTNVNNIYPDMQYFRITKLPNVEDFTTQFKSLEENRDNYPIINYILDKDENTKNLGYLPLINQVCNTVINYCSYKLSRDEAKTIVINKDKEIIDRKILDKFIEVYGKLRPRVEQYDCFVFKDKGGKMLFNDLKKDNYLSNFCPDVGDFNYGMVIASIYMNMISWQNQFINVVLNSNNISDKNYEGLFENEIMIQDCDESDIIKLPSIEDIMNNIIKNSYQKNFGVIIYNYDLIEKELASKYLPQIKKFVSENDKCLRYVIYQFEGFRGNQSNILTQFIEKYKPKELKQEELQIIFNYQIREQNNRNNKFIKILFSLQVLINYILENNNNKNELLSNIISQMEKDENILLLTELFNHENIRKKKLFKVETLMNIFNIFELLCWDQIKDNLLNEYKMALTDKIKNKFDSFYKDQEDKRNITKIKLATALRRLISRYLSGKRNQNEFNEKNNLLLYLTKAELWDEYGFTESQEFNKELYELFSDEENNCLIMVGHGFELYNYLGGDKSLLKEYFGHLEINKKEEKNEIKNEINIKNENNININNENDFNIIKEDQKDINEIIINNEEGNNNNDFNINNEHGLNNNHINIENNGESNLLDDEGDDINYDDIDYGNDDENVEDKNID